MANIKQLIGEVEDIISGEENQRRIDVQRRLNRLETVQPTPFNSFSFSGIFPIVVNAWSKRLKLPIDIELTGKNTGAINPDYAANLIHFQLLQKIEAFKASNDDIPLSSHISTNLGLCWLYRDSPVGEHYRTVPETGAFIAEPILKSEADFEKLEVPRYEFDEQLHKQRIAVFEEMLDGRLLVSDDALPPGIGAPFQTANNLRGVQQILEDFILQPHLVHRVMEFLSQAIVSYVGEMVQLRGGNTGTPSVFGCAGVFGCDEVSCDMFPPSYYDEFIYPYECRAAAVYDTIYYHSCANITPLIEKILTVPNMRRIHVSPWSDLKTAIEVTGKQVILEKWLDPNLKLDELSPDEMRTCVRKVTDCGVDFPLDMRVETNTRGGRLFREIFYEEISAA